MPRHNKSSESRSRSRSPKNKRYRKDSSESKSSNHKKHKYDKKQKDYYSKNSFSLKSRSDIKNHIVYENVKIRHKSDEDLIKEEVKKLLKEEFGPIEHVTTTTHSDDAFSFCVGFKYDKDAYKFVHEGGFINSTIDKTKLIARPTQVFDYCLPMFKDLIKESKKAEKRPKSPEGRKYKRSESSERDHKKKRYSPRGKSHEKKQSKKQYRTDEKSIWMFGLPWSIKGKEVQTYLADHNSGPFPVIRWRWVRVKGSNCEFMQITLEEKKANKLLGLREQQQIEGCPCVITSASNEGDSEDIIKETLRDYQFKVTFPERINPSSLYRALNELARVVQIVSFQKLVDGRSDCFIVTLCSSSKAKDIKRLGLLSSSGIRVDDIRGQLVYRPTKHSRLTEGEH